MKSFSKIGLCALCLLSFFWIFLLQGTSALAVSLQSPGIQLPNPGEMVLTSDKDIPNHLWIAEQYLKKGNFKNVISICDQILNREKNNIEARANLAAAYMGEGNKEKFDREVEQLNKQAPDSSALDLALARTYRALKDFKNAESFYKKGIRIASDKTEPRMELAALYTQLGSFEKASAQYLAVLKTKDLSHDHFLNANFALCQIDLRQNKYDQVIKRAKMMTDLYPPIAQGHLLLAKAYLGKGETDQAIKVYENLITNNQEVSIPYQELALIYSDKLNDYQKALSYAKEAVRRFPEDAKSFDVSGWVYYSHGNYAEAITGFQRAVLLSADNPFYHYHLGLAQQKIGTKGAARKSFEKALNLLDSTASQKFVKEITSRINQCQ